MSKQILWTNQFKKDYKLVTKRGLCVEELDDVIRILASDEDVPDRYRDHELQGKWNGFRECHIKPDWLLIYKIDSTKVILTLVRTGTHSDLFL